MKFSVLISVYVKENPAFLKRALESILNQTLKPNEVVMVKDGTLTGELNNIINFESEKFINKGIDFIIVQLKKNMGLGRALQIGLKKCNYEYIARMDTDDIAIHDRFESQIRYMNIHKDISALGGYIGEFIKDEEIIRVKSMPLKYRELYKYGKYRNPLNHMTVCFRKNDVISSGGYKPLNGLEDYYLWIRMLAKGYKMENMDKVLVNARLGDFEARRGGLKYFLAYFKLRTIQKKLGYTNTFEFITAVFVTAFLTLVPDKLRGVLYKLLRKRM